MAGRHRGSSPRHPQGLKTEAQPTMKGATMIVDDNFVGIVMFALIGVIYLAYKVGEYIGETKQREKREQ